jgi:hypothetical protein
MAGGRFGAPPKFYNGGNYIIRSPTDKKFNRKQLQIASTLFLVFWKFLIVPGIANHIQRQSINQLINMAAIMFFFLVSLLCIIYGEGSLRGRDLPADVKKGTMHILLQRKNGSLIDDHCLT